MAYAGLWLILEFTISAINLWAFTTFTIIMRLVRSPTQNQENIHKKTKCLVLAVNLVSTLHDGTILWGNYKIWKQLGGIDKIYGFGKALKNEQTLKFS